MAVGRDNGGDKPIKWGLPGPWSQRCAGELWLGSWLCCCLPGKLGHVSKYIKGPWRIKLSPVLYCEDKFISDCENFQPCCEGPWKYLERTINFQAASIA